MRRHVFLPLLFLLAGCDRPAEQRTPPLVAVESAFRIVEEVRLQPPVDNPIGQVARIERMAEGVALADLMSSDVKVFDTRGRFVRALGGAGDGPGEMRGPFALIARPGDTLIVLDQRARVAEFGPGGAFLHGWQAPVRPVFGMEIDADGRSLLIAGRMNAGPGIPASATGYEVHRFSRTGRYLGSMVESEAPVARPEVAFMGTPTSLSGGVLTVGRFGRNELRHYDVRTSRHWRSDAGTAFYRAPDWSRATGRTIEDAIRFSEPYAWMEKIIPSDCGIQLVVFERSADGRRDFQYVVHGNNERDVLATRRTELDISGTSGSTFYATRGDERGDLNLVTLSLSDGIARCRDAGPGS